MTVGQLVKELLKLDQKLKVHQQYNYGDHSRTQVAPEIERVEEGAVEHSEYHDMPARVDQEGLMRLKQGQRYAVILR